MKSHLSSRDNLKIRMATGQDRDAIQRVYLCAFPEGEGEIVAKLAIDLLSEITTPQTISLVAETHDAIVGHLAFSPVMAEGNDPIQGYILAPLGVKPEYQKRRIGSMLVEYGVRLLSAKGINIVFVYGDPDYYGRFGFSAATARQYTAPYVLKYPFGWQAIVINEPDIGRSPVAIQVAASLCDPALW